jgi:hypothetical protein
MAFKVFTPGVLTSSDVNTFLMRQAVIVCTSTTRPASPNEGMTIYETDTDSYAVYTGTEWRYQGRYLTFTPTLAGSGWTLKGRTIESRYAFFGDMIHWFGGISWDGTGSQTAGAGFLTLTAPVAAVSSPETLPSHAGTFSMFDDSAGVLHAGGVRFNTTTTVQILNLVQSGAVEVRFNGLDSTYATAGGLIATDNLDRWYWTVVYRWR